MNSLRDRAGPLGADPGIRPRRHGGGGVTPGGMSAVFMICDTWHQCSMNDM